jgi:hypothetical protein
MAKSAAERALEILAEIDEQENLENNNKKPDIIKNATVTKPTAAKKSDPLPQENELNSDNLVKDISRLDKKDLVKGIIISEILNKPLSLRRNRRI